MSNARSEERVSPDPQTENYLHALQEKAEYLRIHQRLVEAEQITREWARACGEAEARLAYGGILQQQDRPVEARQQYAKLHRRDHRRHYHLAALAWQQGEPAEALDHLLQAMLLCRAVARALAYLDQGREPPDCDGYWEKYGHLWSPEARSFLLGVLRQGVVNQAVRQILEEGGSLNRLVPARVRAQVLSRVLNRAGTFPPQRRPEATTT